MPDAQSSSPIVARTEPGHVRRWRSGAMVVAALVAVLGGRALAQHCVGDCNGDGSVRIDELILGVQVDLGSAPVDACPAIDCNEGLPPIIVACMVIAVDNALEGCASDQCGELLCPPCGNVVCPRGQYCCNPLLSICAPPGFACIQ